MGSRKYLLSGDGTGYYSSAKVSSPSCLTKKSKNGKNPLLSADIYDT